MKKQWFEVSREGLKELQAGKPKDFLARELVQNAWDEQTKNCSFNAQWEKGMAIIEVEDDNPTGFKDLSDAFTLFKTTSKRNDPTKRGRFNIGEKQVLSLCEKAEIATTKGTVVFGKKGRRIVRAKRLTGSKITVWLKMTKSEFEEMVMVVKRYLVPEAINFSVNGEKMVYRKPYKSFQTTLLTEKETNGSFTRTQRKTVVNVHKANGKSILYELGLPVTEIDCQFDIDVQQKVPLSIDRDTVPVSYLKTLFAETLNTTYQEIDKENSSELWIRQGMGDKRVNVETVKEMVEKRYGDKVVVANPFDPISVDDAISHGYNVVHGSELSKEEWENIRKAEAIKSSSDLFGHSFVDATPVEPDENMKRVQQLAIRIAKQIIGVELTVRIMKSPKSTVAAQYGVDPKKPSCGILIFNVSSLGKDFFNPPVNAKVIDLIVHELGHHAGHHTEASYHDLITKMAGQLVMLALTDSTFFKVE